MEQHRHPNGRIIKAKLNLQDAPELDDRQKSYNALVDLTKQGLHMIDRNYPDLWEIWGKCTKKYGIPNLTKCGNIREITYTLQTIGILSPVELALAPKGRIGELAATYPSLERAQLIWQTAKCWSEKRLSPSLTTIDIPDNTTENILVEMKAIAIDDTPLAITIKKQRDAIGLPLNFGKLTPMAETSALQALDTDLTTVECFLEGQEKLNILMSIQGSRRSVTSGVRNYIKFCHLVEVPLFPVLHNTIRRSGTFDP